MTDVTPHGEGGDRYVLEVPTDGDSPAEAEHADRGSRVVKDGSAARGDEAALDKDTAL